MMSIEKRIFKKIFDYVYLVLFYDIDFVIKQLERTNW